MSISKIWGTKALEAQRRFALSQVTHLFIQLDIHPPHNGVHGVYCRTPALANFPFDKVLNHYHVQIIAVSGNEDVPRYLRAQERLQMSLKSEVDCEACNWIWVEFRNWAKGRMSRPNITTLQDYENQLIDGAIDINTALKNGYK